MVLSYYSNYHSRLHCYDVLVALLSLSSPRRPESRMRNILNWISACAGMTCYGRGAI